MTPEDLLHEYGPCWALQFVPLCSSMGEHSHGSVRCASPGKVPLVSRWPLLPDHRRQNGVAPETVAAEMTLHLQHQGNVGIAVPAGVLVLDADTPEAARRLARACPDAPLQRTSAGAHVVTRLPEGRSFTNSCNREIEPGLVVDLRGQGSQIVCWPSIHHSGAAYEWQRPLPKTCAELPLIPDLWLVALKTQKCGERRREPEEWVRAMRADVAEGSRHSTLLSIAGKLLGSNLDPVLAYELVHLYNRAQCKPPLLDAEVDRLACDIAQKELEGHSRLKLGGQKLVV